MNDFALKSRNTSNELLVPCYSSGFWVLLNGPWLWRFVGVIMQEAVRAEGFKKNDFYSH
jgi:hypothetical protein